MAYIGVFVRIHGLDHGRDEDDVIESIRLALEDYFESEEENDIEIEIKDHGGLLCHDDDHEVK